MAIESFPDQAHPAQKRNPLKSIFRGVIMALVSTCLCVCVVSAGIWRFGTDPIFETTVSLFTRIIESDPTNANAYFLRGHSYYGLGRLDEAVGDFSHSIELDPNNGLVYYQRGYLYYLLGQFEEAANDNSRAIELNPEFLAAYNNRAYFLALADRDLDQALEDVNYALEKNPNSSTFLDTRALVYYRLGDYDNALIDAKAAVNSGEPFAYYTLGLIYEAQGETQAAIESYRNFLNEFDQVGNLPQVEDARARLARLNGR